MKRKYGIMDLIIAADYIEEMERKAAAEGNRVEAAAFPKKVLADVTNTTCILPRFKTLLHGKLRRSLTPEPFYTPKKRRPSYAKENIPSPRTPKNVIYPQVKQSESPPTPLSNLKLLTKIASAQSPIKSASSQVTSSQKPSLRVSTEIISPNISTQNSLQSCQETLDMEDENAIKKFLSEVPRLQLNICPEKVPLRKHLTYGDEIVLPAQGQSFEPSRKEKSLGVLVERFLHNFPLEISCLQTPRNIAIDDVASLLSTERRRVYDIINILESLNMAERVHKNAYQWRGKQQLEITLSRLKRLAVQWGVNSQGYALFYPGNQLIGSPASPSDGVMARKNKSLGVLCQKFMMLLLVSPAPHIVSLDAAITFLLGQTVDPGNPSRTKGRRIYDIANVLMSLQLVKRLPQSKSFQYIGPVVVASTEYEDIYTQLSRTRHSLLSPSAVILTNGTRIANIQSQLEVTPSSSNVCNPKRSYKAERVTKAGGNSVPKAKRNCLVMSAPNIIPLCKTVPSRPAKRENLFKTPPVDKQRVHKPKALFARHPAQIVPASKTKSVTYIHPNIKSMEHNSTRVALTFSEKKPQKAVPAHRVNIKKPQFCSAKSKNLLQSSPNPSPMMFIGNCVRSLRRTQPAATPSVIQVSGSSPVPVGKQSPTPKATVDDQQAKQASLPSINFNTLSKSHYKTVIGAVPLTAAQNATSRNGYRFVITNNSSVASSPVTKLQSSNEFVKVIHHITERPGQ